MTIDCSSLQSFYSSNFNLDRVFTLHPTNQNCNLLLMVVTYFLCYLRHSCLTRYPKIPSDRFLMFLPVIPKKSLNPIAVNAGKSFSFLIYKVILCIDNLSHYGLGGVSVNFDNLVKFLNCVERYLLCWKF